jgi:LPXTG-motif cell wall-anchored protein
MKRRTMSSLVPGSTRNFRGKSKRKVVCLSLLCLIMWQVGIVHAQEYVIAYDGPIGFEGWSLCTGQGTTWWRLRLSETTVAPGQTIWIFLDQRTKFDYKCPEDFEKNGVYPVNRGDIDRVAVSVSTGGLVSAAAMESVDSDLVLWYNVYEQGGVAEGEPIPYHFDASFTVKREFTVPLDAADGGYDFQARLGNLTPTNVVTLEVGSGGTTETGRAGLVVSIALGTDTELDNRENYVVGDTLYVKITVKDSWTDNGVPSARLTMRWTHEESGKSTEFEDSTNPDGVYTTHAFLGEDYVGRWMIAVVASAQGYPDEATSYRTFTVGKQAPQYLVELKTDKQVYKSGQRVVVTGAVKRFESDSYVGVQNVPIDLLFSFPDGGQVKIPLMKADPHVVTDNDGEFRIVPFAPYNLGEYSITVLFNPQDDPKFSKDATLKPNVVQSTVKFTAETPPAATQKQFDEIIQRFLDEVPPHQEQVKEALKKMKSPMEMQDISEMEYGLWNNRIFHENGFNCPGYRDKTLRVLNDLRFSENSADRDLLAGVDYIPVERGYETEWEFWGEHHAVVLYPFLESWFDDSQRVLDPWPRQMPAVYTVKELTTMYGLEGWDLGRWSIRADPEYMYNPETARWAFPMPRGGEVYWNLDWKEAGISYIVSPEMGLNGPWGSRGATGTWDGVDVAGGSPIALDISNDGGQHVGVLEDGRLVAEIPKSQLEVYQRPGGDFAWYVWLPEGDYHVRIVALEDGHFRVSTSRMAGVFYFYEASIGKGQSATFELGTEKLGEQLTLPNGELVTPTKISVETEPKTGDGAWLLFGVIGLSLVAAMALYVVRFRKLARSRFTAPPRSAVAATVAYCENCGKQIISNSAYCPYCGDKQGV